MPIDQEKTEKVSDQEYLRYEGNTVPRVIRFAWTILFVFIVGYCVKYLWPDLMEWLTRLK